MERTLRKARIARDNSPSAMESASDVSRSRLEATVVALEQMKKEKEGFLSRIPIRGVDSEDIKLWSFAEIELSGNKMKIVVVPEGLGGIEISGFRYVSCNTPFGVALVGKKRGDNFSYNGLMGVIVPRRGVEPPLP